MHGVYFTRPPDNPARRILDDVTSPIADMRSWLAAEPTRVCKLRVRRGSSV
jgi:hypothetical protein